MFDKSEFNKFPLSSALILAVGAVGLILYACLHAGPYALRLLTVAGAYALATIGYQAIFGLCGALSLAQGAFFGVGAYVSGVLALRFGLDFAVTAAAALLAPTLCAILVGLTTLRLESHYFALATLGAAQIALLAVVNGPESLGGANGLPGVPGVVLFGVAVPRGLPLAALAWGLAAAAGAAVWLLARGRFGRSMVLARDNPLAAACLGLDVGRLRLAAFALSAACAGLGGAVAAHAQRVVSPEALEFPVMATVLTMAVVGGRGRVAGAAIGALLLTFSPEWLGWAGQGKMLLYGLALLAAVILAPQGIAGALAGFDRRRKSRAPGAASPSLPSVHRRFGADGAPAVLEIRGLTKAFGGVRAADGVDLRLSAGEIVGLIGPNGSGKTTLINLLSGVERPDAGSVLFNGVPAPPTPHLRARAGLARSFQTPALSDAAGGLETVAAAFYADGLSHAAAEAAAWPMLAQAGLTDVADAPVASLPMAVRRRLDLARALARRPALLLLDEPAAGLTVAERARTADLIRQAATDSGAAVLAVDHDMGFLLPLCSRLVCLDRGRVIYDGPAASAAADPAVRAAYFGGAG